MKEKDFWRWVPALVFGGIVYWISIRPPAPGAGTGTLSPLLIHAGTYAVLAFLVGAGFKFSRDGFPRVFLMCTLFGALIEVHQAFLSYRYFGFTDIAANAAGALSIYGVGVGKPLLGIEEPGSRRDDGVRGDTSS